jgi:hypothetical protein
MGRRLILSAFAVALLVGLWLASPSQSQAQDPTRYVYYPYYYFPHSYYPNHVKWPDPKKPFQQPPAYMAYPPYLDGNFRYELFEPKKYYKGFHFWLDQF